VRQRGSERGVGQGLRRGGLAAVVLLAGGFLAAACSSSSTSASTTAASPATTAAAAGSGSGLASIVRGIKRGSGATFSATYVTADSTTGKSQTVTFAQSSPKSAVVTPTGSFYIDGSSVTACQGSGASATCTSLPSSLSSSLGALTDLFSPGVLTTTLERIETEAAARVAGISVHTSSATYGGLASSCATLTSTGTPKPVTYCVADSSGILTYSSTNGTTVTLTAFTANPPASTFSPPSGATVQTLPAGT
jgi:hypothetical protein